MLSIAQVVIQFMVALTAMTHMALRRYQQLIFQALKNVCCTQSSQRLHSVPQSTAGLLQTLQPNLDMYLSIFMSTLAFVRSRCPLLMQKAHMQWQRLKMKAESDQLKECTFAPKTNRRRAPHEWEPLPTRLGRLQKMRRCGNPPPPPTPTLPSRDAHLHL